MRCIFCKLESSSSTSVEHIIPESLGNAKAVLPAGVVCDACNNYFATKVEKPFLESPAMTTLRFHQAVSSKRGRVPSLDGVLMPGYPVTLSRELKGPFAGSLTAEPHVVQQMLKTSRSTVVVPADGPPPDDFVASRFLAKVALEALAARLLDSPGGMEYIVEEAQLDAIRNHARRGYPRDWPYHSRRIYDTDRRYLDENGQSVQVVHEFDLLYTSGQELYLVLAIFGLELVINLGGPETTGYVRWLAQNAGASALYIGRNSEPLGAS